MNGASQATLWARLAYHVRGYCAFHAHTGVKCLFNGDLRAIIGAHTLLLSLLCACAYVSAVLWSRVYLVLHSLIPYHEGPAHFIDITTCSAANGLLPPLIPPMPVVQMRVSDGCQTGVIFFRRTVGVR